MFECSDLFLENYNEKSDIVINQGGTWSGKTYSILQVLFCFAVSQPKIIITVTGQDLPNLKSGSLRDALSIYDSSEQLKQLIANYNKTSCTFEFANGSIMEFKSYADSQDARNGKRDYLFINEANGVSYEIYKQLALRTRVRTFIDYNPSSEFWVHEHLIGKEGTRLIISDHRRNNFMSEKQHAKIEALKGEDEELWKVYARGMTGRIEGLIYRNWSAIAAMPSDAKLIGYGLDFGFTNDPTALVEVREQNGQLYLQLHIYETGLTNQMISDRLWALMIDRSAWIIADSAEPKSIAELHTLGWKIEGANKGPDSIKNGIDILKRYKLNIVGSQPLQKELNSYKWRTDKISGKQLNEPVDALNHGLDAARYLALNRLANTNAGKYVII